MMNTAILDIGTNTLILLIVEVFPNGSFRVIHDVAKIVRLGEGINKNRLFCSEAMERTLVALLEFAELIKKNDCDPIIALGTAACRNAINAAEFVQRVKNETGIGIQVISGEKEAALSALATAREFSSLSQPRLTIDIGGGSTEFILTNGETLSAQSLEIGSVRLTEQFIKNDPPSPEEISAVSEFIESQLEKFLPQKNIPPQLQIITTAGTATSLAALHLGLENYDPDLVHKSKLSTADLENILAKLRSLPLVIRQMLPGLSPKRADVIISGTLILLKSLQHFKTPSTWISDRGLRFGALYDWIESEQGFTSLLDYSERQNR